jgi:hypothetical protein
VTTGNIKGAGTNAKVYMTIYGKNGDSGPKLLEVTRYGKWRLIIIF